VVVPVYLVVSAVPPRPDAPIPPDDASERVREATELLTQAVDRLRDARDLLDEAAQVEFLPNASPGGSRPTRESSSH
jgi:hypothetical protein